jgi:hypothetical protein
MASLSFPQAGRAIAQILGPGACVLLRNWLAHSKTNKLHGALFWRLEIHTDRAFELKSETQIHVLRQGFLSIQVLKTRWKKIQNSLTLSPLLYFNPIHWGGCRDMHLHKMAWVTEGSGTQVEKTVYSSPFQDLRQSDNWSEKRQPQATTSPQELVLFGLSFCAWR